MKVMIMSDSHSMAKDQLVSLMKLYPADYYIHCGDIYLMYDGLANNDFYIVRGNNDRSSLREELKLTIDHLKFWVVHGDRYNVDYNIDSLVHHAKDLNVDIVCFGHTHNPFYQVIDGITFINPGSLSYPRGHYRSPTFCMFDTSNQSIVYYDVKTHQICDPFKKEERKKFSFFKKKKIISNK